MVNTPEGTRKPNGTGPPRGTDPNSYAASSTTGKSKYDPVKKYDPRDYARGDEGQAVSPSPGVGRRPSAPGAMVKYNNNSSSNFSPQPAGAVGSSAYRRDDDSSTPRPIPGTTGRLETTAESQQDARRKRPGDASSYYGGTPPSFPPAPAGHEGEGEGFGGAGAYSMSGALGQGQGQGQGQGHGSGYPSSHRPQQAGAHGNSGAVAGSTASMAGPASYAYFPGPPTQQQQQNEGEERGLRAARVDTESALREYLEVQQKVRFGASVEDKERLKRCAGRALAEVKELRKELNVLVKRPAGGRVGRFIVGGIVAGTIPIIKRFFRRPSDNPASKTEYAYKKSQSMVSKILSTLHKTGWAASLFMFVLAALYVFQAEVMIRVAKTMYKRLKRLVVKMEEGERLGKDGMVVMEESDLKVLKGWRWRVLLWSK